MRVLVPLLALLLAEFPLSAQVSSPAARPDPGIRGSLESVYEAWRQSMERRDLAMWERVTSLSRQIETRNRIVSQKAPFPEALFADPIAAPSLGGLIALGVYSTGETAAATYFGRANFGPSDVPVSENLIVLHFHREDDGWKFDKLRVVKTGDDGEILLQIRNRDFGFLRGEEFQPEPLPPIPQPVTTPDFIGELWVSSIGYKTEIRVNGHLCAEVDNAQGKDLVMGGVRRGTNSIQIRTEGILTEEGSTPRLEIAIYAAEGPGLPAKRVFHYRPGSEASPLVQETFASP